MTPKNGRSGMSMPAENRATLRGERELPFLAPLDTKRKRPAKCTQPAMTADEVNCLVGHADGRIPRAHMLESSYRGIRVKHVGSPDLCASVVVASTAGASPGASVDAVDGWPGPNGCVHADISRNNSSGRMGLET